MSVGRMARQLGIQRRMGCASQAALHLEPRAILQQQAAALSAAGTPVTTPRLRYSSKLSIRPEVMQSSGRSLNWVPNGCGQPAVGQSAAAQLRL